MKLEKLQQDIKRAIQALEELEQALGAGDHRTIGARLYELRQALREAEREAQAKGSRHRKGKSHDQHPS